MIAMQGRPWPVRIERVVDAVLVSTAFLVGLAGHVAARSNPEVEAAPLSFAILVFAALAAAVLWWRRERPLQMLIALVLVAIVAGVVGEPALFSVQLGIETMILLHAAGSWGRHLRASVGVVAGSMLLVVAGAMGNGSGILAAGAFALALIAFPFAVGYAARTRRRYLEAVEERLRRAEEERDEQARRALEAERARIARELHDVVAHHVSLIGVQAGAARTALDHDADSSRVALMAIEESSRDAVGEMHRLLGVLRPVGDHDRAPQPGLHALAGLADRWNDAGLDATVSVTGDLGTVPPDVSLSAYRIIEESLTNVARHSQARHVDVSIEIDGEAVVVEVADPGPPANSGHSGGRGLIGMRERVALYGGEISAHPVDGRGFVVCARLPRKGR